MISITDPQKKPKKEIDPSNHLARLRPIAEQVAGYLDNVGAEFKHDRAENVVRFVVTVGESEAACSWMLENPVPPPQTVRKSMFMAVHRAIENALGNGIPTRKELFTPPTGDESEDESEDE